MKKFILQAILVFALYSTVAFGQGGYAAGFDDTIDNAQDAAIAALDTATNTITSDVDNLNTATNNLTADVASLDTATNTLTGDVDNLNTATNTLTADVDSLDTATNTLTANVGSLDTATNILTASVVSLESKTNKFWGYMTFIIQDPTNGVPYWQKNPYVGALTVDAIWAYTRSGTGQVSVIQKAANAPHDDWTVYVDQAIEMDYNGVSGGAMSGTAALSNTHMIGVCEDAVPSELSVTNVHTVVLRLKLQ